MSNHTAHTFAGCCCCGAAGRWGVGSMGGGVERGMGWVAGVMIGRGAIIGAMGRIGCCCAATEAGVERGVWGCVERHG